MALEDDMGTLTSEVDRLSNHCEELANSLVRVTEALDNLAGVLEAAAADGA